LIGKQSIETRPATLVEVADIMEKRLEDAEEEAKRRKKEKLDKPAPIVPPAPVIPEGEIGSGAAAQELAAAAAEAPKPPEDKSPLGLEQRSTLEYAKKFAKIGKRKAEEMREKLMKMGKMKPEIAVKIIDLMPVNKEQIKLIFAKERVTASDEDVSAVIKLVEEFKK